MTIDREVALAASIVRNHAGAMDAGAWIPSALQDVGLTAIGRSLPWFEEQLDLRSLAVHPDSGLGASLAELRKLMNDAREGRLIRTTSAEFQRRYLAATGADFLSKVLHWGYVSKLSGFDGHWRYLRASNPVLTGPGSGKVARERAQAWELVLASLVATFCRRVEAAEPDVRCEWEGIRVGVAAKVLFKNSRNAFSEHVKKGIQQIQAADVDAGCVVINLVDVFPHAETFEAFHRRRYKHASTAAVACIEWVEEFLESNAPDWRRLFSKKSKLLTIAMFLPTVLTTWKAQPTPFTQYRLHLFSVAEREDEAVRFTTALQRAFDAALAFDVGDPRSAIDSAG